MFTFLIACALLLLIALAGGVYRLASAMVEIHRCVDATLTLLQLDATTEALKRYYGADFAAVRGEIEEFYPLVRTSLAWPPPCPWAAPDPSTACRASNVWPPPAPITNPQHLAA